MSVFAVKLASTAGKAFQALAPEERTRIRGALERLAVDVAVPGRIGGKPVKSIKGAHDSFHRLRVGDLRVMYDVMVDEQTVLVLGIVHRRDLEGWLRQR